MRYYLLAGEASGDLHGYYLMRAIRETDPTAEFRFWGGDRMAEIGGAPVVHYRERAIMGFAQVIAKLPKVLGFLRRAKRDIAAWQPDRLIFIDNSGFNLPLARWAKPRGFATHYYIGPQVWASREGRIKTIKAAVDRMYVVLPFVKDFYTHHGYAAEFVGHPLLDVVDGFLAKYQSGASSFEPDFSVVSNKIQPIKTENFGGVKDNIVSMLPGSRGQEIAQMLPIMLAAAAHRPEANYVIAVAPARELGEYQRIFDAQTELPPKLYLSVGRTYELFAQADRAIITSGTASLEAGLFGVPQVICYRGSWLEYQIARRLIRVDHISLVNLVLGREVAKELVQNDLTPARLTNELDKLLAGPERDRQLRALGELRQKLGPPGAARRAAAMICES